MCDVFSTNEEWSQEEMFENEAWVKQSNDIAELMGKDERGMVCGDTLEDVKELLDELKLLRSDQMVKDNNVKVLMEEVKHLRVFHDPDVAQLIKDNKEQDVYADHLEEKLKRLNSMYEELEKGYKELSRVYKRQDMEIAILKAGIK